MVEPGRLEVELVGLAGARRRGLDLAHLVREQIHLAFAIAFALVELGERSLRIPQATVLDAKRLDRVEVLTTRVPVEEACLGDRREQPLALVLAVHLDELAGELREGGHRRQLSTHTRGAAPLRGHGPCEQDLPVLGPPGARRRGGSVEPRLHLRGPRARPNERGPAAPAEREL